MLSPGIEHIVHYLVTSILVIVHYLVISNGHVDTMMIGEELTNEKAILALARAGHLDTC